VCLRFPGIWSWPLLRSPPAATDCLPLAVWTA